jgi:hypothetical protein
MPEEFAPIDFSFEPPPDKLLEDTDMLNVPFPCLIVPVERDRLGQSARIHFYGRLSGSSNNGGSLVP